MIMESNISNIDFQDFYDMITDLGENIKFKLDDGREINTKCAIVPQHKKVNSDGIYQKYGNMIFPDGYEQQELLWGEYFERESVPNGTKSILRGISNEVICDGKIGTVYVAECNETVDIVSYFETETNTETGDTEETPVYAYKNIPVYMKMETREQTSTQIGSVIQTSTILIIPAKYNLSLNNVILKDNFIWDSENKKNIWAKTRYKIESIDTSMMSYNGKTGQFKGVLTCLLSEDKR